MEVDCNSKSNLISEPISYEFQLEEPTSIVVLDKSKVRYFTEEVEEDGKYFPSLTILSTYEVKCKAFVSFTATFKLGNDENATKKYPVRSDPFTITIHVKKVLLQPAQDRQVSQNDILWKFGSFIM